MRGQNTAGTSDGAEVAMLELVGSELVKRGEERRKRKEARLKQQEQTAAAEEKKDEKVEK